MQKVIYKLLVLGLVMFCIFPSVLFAQPLDQESLPSSVPLKSLGSSLESKVVRAIEVRGNKTISIASILAKIKTRVGQEYLQTIISDDVKRLYSTGYFSDVSVDRQDYEDGFRVIITVEEKPIVEKVTFSKTRYIKGHALLSKIQTRQGKFLDPKALKDDVNTIQELYAKKGLTNVTIEVETKKDEVSNKAKIHFIITEGGQIRIKQINVYGNKAFGQKAIIRVIKTRAKTFFNSGFLNEDILKEDMERITSFYEKVGYIDASADYSLDYGEQGKLAVNIKIAEGKQYFVEDVHLTGYSVATQKEITDVIQATKPGLVFSREKLKVDVNNIQSLYFDKGYIFAKVIESTSLNPQTGKVNVKMDIKEGNLAYVNKIKIQGNTRTRDIVIRRELRLHPGDQFDGSKLRRSKERLRNLGYFDDIGYDIEDTGTADKKDLIVQVKEAKTGTFSFGGGFSTVDKVVGFVEIEQKNFDFSNWPTFTGGGQNFVARAETGSVRNNLRLSFTEPWIFDYPVSGGFDIFRTERDKERDTGYTYDETRTGGDVRFGKQFTEYVSGNLLYRLENIDIGNFDSNVSADLKAEEGKNIVSSTGFEITRDARDSSISPTKGLIVSSGLDIAGGFLGGDKDFYRIESRAGYHIPLKFNSVLEFRIRGGIVDSYGDSDKVPIFERFFVGGARTIRGYNERKVGPLDSATEDPIGGESLLVGNIEYTIPLIDFLKLASFFDVGNVWSKVDDFGNGGYKSGAGFGLRVKTPIGPVNLDYGYPLNDEPGEDSKSGKFYFSVSRGF